MERRRIGSLEVSAVGLGCNNFGWRIDAAATARVVDAALDSGIDFFDTADMYDQGQSEEFLAAALKGRRNRIVLATKFGREMKGQGEGASAAYIKVAVEASLRRLGTDCIDLYQLHKPYESTPIEETLAALDQLVRQGKVREIGASNFSAAQIRDADAAAGDRARFVSVQNEYSIFHREPEADVLSECLARDIAFLPYFPLANGLLTGKYRKGQPLPEGSRASDAWGPKVFTDQNLETVEKLAAFADSRGRTLLELAFGWLLSRQGVASVIAGAKSPEQVRQNAASGQWRLTLAEIGEVDRLAPRTPA